MGESLTLFFNAFRHFPSEDGERKISYVELMCLSWVMHLLAAIYSVGAVYLGVKSYDYLSTSQDFSHLMFSSFSFTLQKWSLISTLFSVVFYPFIFQFAFKFWKGSFKFYGNIFECEDERFDEKCDDILSTAFSSNLFLILPIVGNVFSNIAMPYFIFSGLKKKLAFSSTQAGLVIMTPMFLIFLFAIFSATYFAFLLTLI